MGKSIIFDSVCKRFGNKIVLNKLSFEVKAGESFVILGGSGQGKTVALQCLLGLLQVDSGHIYLDGVEVSLAKNHPFLYRHVSMLFQGGALFDSLRVWENVAFGIIAQKKASKKDAYPMALSTLERVGLNEATALLYPASLSGGMKKRAALARTIAPNPSVLLFDEPTTGLDPITSARINQLIVKCVKILGATGISITHNLACASIIGDKVGMMYEGSLLWQGSIKDLHQTKNPYVQQFLHGKTEGPMKEHFSS